MLMLRKFQLFALASLVCSIISCEKVHIRQGECTSTENKEPIIEAYTPKGAVEEVLLPNGNTIYLDLADSTYFFSDMIFSKDYVRSLDTLKTKSACAHGLVYYWPNNNITYSYSQSLSVADTNAIFNGLKLISDNSPLTFTYTTNVSHADLRFVASSSNSSPVGKQTSGNDINIYNFDPGIIAHEVLHSLGFFHEQSRTDRDDYIVINTNNIIPGKEHNFTIFTDNGYQGFDRGEYDYNSIMHYGPTAFAKSPGLITISRKDGGYLSGQRYYLTQGDIAGLNFIYGPKPILSEESTYYDDIGPDYVEFTTRHTYTVSFKNPDGTPLTLQYPKLVLAEIVHTSSNDYSPGISTGVYQRYYIVPAGVSSYTIEQTHDLYQADMGIVREDSTERLTLKW